MIRVMVVEDEPPIMRVIIKLIEKYGGAFEVVAKAYNGKQAIELMQSMSIDLVFSDIRMPVKDGLKLAEYIHLNKISTKVVLISGYQDFEYARQAINYQVVDYLVKPVKQTVLHTLLASMEATFVEANKAAEKGKIIQSINEEYSVERPNMGEEKKYSVLLICAGPFPMAVQEGMLPGEPFWNEIHLESMITPILEKGENSLIFRGKTSVEKVVVMETSDTARIQQVGEQLFNRLVVENSIPITIVGDRQLIGISAIGEKLKYLRKKLYTQIKLFESQILWEKVDMERTTLAKQPITVRKILEGALTTSPEQLEEVLLLHQQEGYTQLQTVSFIQYITTTVYFKQSQQDLTLLKLDIEVAVSNALDIHGLAKEITSILLEYNEEVKKPPKEKSNIAVAKEIEVYLEAHYQDVITTNMLAKKFNFVPSYVSKIFKSYKGMSPSEYLNYYRIEKSKQLMDENPNVLCKEVAQLVGYPDHNYFSKIFKKQTGMWPTAYLNREE